jgi:hypothetical protein
VGKGESVIGLEENLSAPLYRAHPAFGLIRVVPDEPLFPPGESYYPAEWLELNEQQEEEVLTGWYSDLMNAVARIGDSHLYIELSDDRGRETLLRLSECLAVDENRLAFKCKATPMVIQAALQTNPSRVFQLVDGNVYISAFDAWEGMFLHVDDAALVKRFVEPARI